MGVVYIRCGVLPCHPRMEHSRVWTIYSQSTWYPHSGGGWPVSNVLLGETAISGVFLAAASGVDRFFSRWPRWQGIIPGTWILQRSFLLAIYLRNEQQDFQRSKPERSSAARPRPGRCGPLLNRTVWLLPDTMHRRGVCLL